MTKKNEFTNQQKLIKFLDEAVKHVDSMEKDQDTCYLILQNLVHVTEALTEGDENMACTISFWFEENKDELRFCATDDDFCKIVDQINKNTGWLCDPDNFIKPANNSDMTLEEILGQLTF